MKKSDVETAVKYLEEIAKNPKEKEQFNRSIQRAAQQERKRKDGEFTALFLSAIRIP